MKHVFITIAAFILSLALGLFVARKLKTTNTKTVWKILIVIGISIACLSIVFGIYYFSSYRAGDIALIALQGSDLVSVEKVDGGYYFDGPGKDRAIIFYSGGGVQSEAYAPLMLALSGAGFDCFLADMPFNFPLFWGNIADKFISSYNYDTWIMAGHSLGGVEASGYAADHLGEVDGLILLSSYPSELIDDSISLLLIYGSEDKVLSIDSVTQSIQLWPNNSQKYIIAGGNHSQFGDYGEQSGDGIAYITADEQIDETVRLVMFTYCPNI